MLLLLLANFRSNFGHKWTIGKYRGKARNIGAAECYKNKGTTKDMCEIDSIFRQLATIHMQHSLYKIRFIKQT